MELVPAQRLQRALDVAAEFERTMSASQAGASKVTVSAQDAIALLKKLQGALQPEDDAVKGGADAAVNEASGNFECIVCMGE
jgi:hypothetical protein